MKLSTQIKPISYLKCHAAEVIRNIAQQREPLIITQNGEAKVVLQDIASYEQTQETMALLKILALGNRQIESQDLQKGHGFLGLLKILALGNRQIEAGEIEPASNVIKRLRERRSDD